MIRFVLAALVATTLSASAAEPTEPITPALLARTKDGAVAFTLERTSVDAMVVGVMSNVRVKQTYRNPFTTPIEAVYVFPLPEHAAVHSMVMRVGERRITADVKKRAEAKATYEAAREEGKTAALLEEEREDVFTQSIANILPGDAIEVELQYTQELVPVDGEYEFVFPTVVTPRYAGRAKDADRVSPPRLADGLRPGNDVTIHLWIEAGVPIEALRSPTHDVDTKMPKVGTAVVDLRPADRIPNKDFVVRYRLAGQHARAAALAASDVHGGHMLLMLQPQVDLRSADAAPREYVFVVDVSGSMSGEPHERCKAAMALLLRDLRPSDRVQVILFESGVQSAWASSQPATKANVDYALRFVDTSDARGGTEVLPALKAAVEAPRASGLAREVVLMTDGGIASEDLVLEYLRAHMKGLNVFAFGVGSSVNRAFIDALARIGHGEPFVLYPSDDARKATQKLFKLMSRPSLTDVSIDWGGLPVHDMTPAHPPDLFADRPIVVSAKLDHADHTTSGTITVHGLLAGKPYSESVPLVVPAETAAGSSLAYLWARRRITELTDEHPSDERAQKRLEAQVTELGLAYHLVTPYTSFVAVDERVRTQDKPMRVLQPVPLPQGVSMSAAPSGGYVYGSLSSYSVRGGDPELQVFAPRDATSVAVVLPHGETKVLRWDAPRERWITSFLVPVDLREGVHTLTIVVERAHAAPLVRHMRMRVDQRDPDFELALDRTDVEPGAVVTLTAGPRQLAELLPPLAGDIGDPDFAAKVQADAEELVLVSPDGTLVHMQAGFDHVFTATITAPRQPGHYVLPVLARDGARNGERLEIELTVHN